MFVQRAHLRVGCLILKSIIKDPENAYIFSFLFYCQLDMVCRGQSDLFLLGQVMRPDAPTLVSLSA